MIHYLKSLKDRRFLKTYLLHYAKHRADAIRQKRKQNGEWRAEK